MTPTNTTNTTSTISPTSLRRLRWAVRATLILGVTVSVTANVLHARTEPIAQAIAAWPPLALLITVDLVSRVPIHRKLLGGIRITATFAIAAIAAFISYGHMAGVAAKYGEAGIVPYLLPLSVDGMIIVASVSLVELAGRLRDTTLTPPPTAKTPQPKIPTNMMNSTDPAELSAVDTQPSLTAAHTTGDTTPNKAEIKTENPEKGKSDDTASDPHQPSTIPPSSPTDLAPLMEAARQARDELHDEGITISRDALAARLRRNGHPLRTSRATELLAALKAEITPSNGHRPGNPH